MKKVWITSAFWLVLLASCGSLQIKTWIIDDQGLRHKTDTLDESLSFVLAMGYRCYSEIDDTAWRTHLAELDACCSAK